MSEERKIQAGELQKVQASEETTRRNVLAMIEHTNATRKMVLELAKIVDALQNKMISQDKLYQQMRKQLANLQQEFYRRGSVSYSDGEG